MAKKCDKCGKNTLVYSYYFDYDLEEVEIGASEAIGLGNLKYMDKLLCEKYNTIKNKYSYTTKETSISNVCSHCGTLQGCFYVVEDPHEIYIDLWENHSMDKYLIETIKIADIKLLLPNLLKLFNY